MRTVIRYIFILMNVVPVLLLLATAVVRLFYHEPPWIFELLSLGYPYYLAINVAFLLFWLIMKKFWYALVLFCVMALTYPLFFDTFAFGSEREIKEEDQTLTILTYNVKAFNHWGWRERATVQGEIFALVKQVQPDIICFQEYHHDRQEKFQFMDSVQQQLGLHYEVEHRVHSIEERYFYGPVIFSRYPIVRSGRLDFGNSGNVSMWADIVRNGDTVRVYNNHLESYRLQPLDFETMEQVADGENVEMEEVQNVLQKITSAMRKRSIQSLLLSASLRECPYKTLVCGDFNAPPYSFTYHIIRGNNNLRDAFLETSQGVGGTFHWRFVNKRIDFILTHPDVTPMSSQVLRFPFSDHYPVAAVVKVN
ncbi:MAG: endonuclease/exonuclease/phosphatase family protein [Bacteroidales bacterium]|jgi:endonuclease/exonuclease/phosphatase family metal-dependent hydrolase|nr:endonuclease/exonuclease/phosphatase family protein [Bacteroidales bacterium]